MTLQPTVVRRRPAAARTCRPARSVARAEALLLATLLAAAAWSTLPGAVDVALGAGAAPPTRAGSPVGSLVGSLRDSPGYVPLVDPESTATAAGRRTNAPLVSTRFAGGARSLDDLGRAVCRALHVADRDSLLALCVGAGEFRDILWREFPQSRPATGLTWEDGWRALSVRLLAGSHQAVIAHGAHRYRFMRFESDSIAGYRNFKLHHGLVMVVEDDAGAIQRWNWLRAVAERKGVFKIYSTDD